MIDGLALDKVPRVTLGRKMLISISKSQSKLEVNNGKQVTISRALRAGNAQVKVP